jgi:Flp pilus assembly protein TadD
VAALCCAILLTRKIVPFLTAGLTWSLITTLPVCGIVFIYQGMAERFDYLPSIGIALSMTALAFRLEKPLKQIFSVLMILWVLWGAWRLKLRVLDWTDPISLYQSSLEATPDATLFYNLGWAWRERGDNEKALANYQEATRLKPDYQEAQASVAQIFTMLGQPSKALPAYHRALVLRPNDSDTRVDLGVTLEQLGNRVGAESEFRTALRTSPNNVSALDNLGSLLVLEGKFDEAITYFDQAIRATPTDKYAYYSLGGLAQQRGQLDKALAYYQKVLQLDPNDPDTLANVAQIYRQR